MVDPINFQVKCGNNDHQYKLYLLKKRDEPFDLRVRGRRVEPLTFQVKCGSNGHKCKLFLLYADCIKTSSKYSLVLLHTSGMP